MEKFFSKSKYVLPLSGVFLLLIYFNMILNDSRVKFEERLFAEEINWVKAMTAKLESEENAYSDSTVKRVMRDYIISAIEDADRAQGVFACALDMQFNLASKRYYSNDRVSIDSLDISERERAFIASEKSGYIDLRYGERMMRTFFVSYPRNGTQYYILIGISPYLFDEVFNVNRITLVLFLIIAVMLVCVYSGIIEFNKKRQSNET